MDLNEATLQGALDGQDGLDDERVGVLEVEMHDAHHTDADHLGAEEGAELDEVVFLDGGCYGLGIFAGAHRGGFDVFEGFELCQEGRLGGVSILERGREGLDVPGLKGRKNAPFFL